MKKHLMVEWLEDVSPSPSHLDLECYTITNRSSTGFHSQGAALAFVGAELPLCELTYCHCSDLNL